MTQAAEEVVAKENEAITNKNAVVKDTEDASDLEQSEPPVDINIGKSHYLL